MRPVSLVLVAVAACSASSRKPDLATASAIASAAGITQALQAAIEERCKSLELKECDNLARALLRYAEGERSESKERLRLFASGNAPEKVRAVAKTIATLKAIPGAEQKLPLLLEAASFLAPRTVGRIRTPDEIADEIANRLNAAADVDFGAASSSGRLVTADTDLSRFDGGIATPGSGRESVAGQCGSAAIGAVRCWWQRVAIGPFIVTDFSTVADCQGRVVVAVTGGITRWALTGVSKVDVHGARIAVQSGEAFFVGIVPSEEQPDQKCAIAWSGFRPYEAGAGRVRTVAE
jgi:hypothetical protein